MKRVGLLSLSAFTSTSLVALVDAGAPMWLVLGVVPLLAALAVAGYYTQE